MIPYKAYKVNVPAIYNKAAKEFALSNSPLNIMNGPAVIALKYINTPQFRLPLFEARLSDDDSNRTIYSITLERGGIAVQRYVTWTAPDLFNMLPNSGFCYSDNIEYVLSMINATFTDAHCDLAKQLHMAARETRIEYNAISRLFTMITSDPRITVYSNYEFYKLFSSMNVRLNVSSKDAKAVTYLFTQKNASYVSTQTISSLGYWTPVRYGLLRANIETFNDLLGAMQFLDILGSDSMPVTRISQHITSAMTNDVILRATNQILFKLLWVDNEGDFHEIEFDDGALLQLVLEVIVPINKI